MVNLKEVLNSRGIKLTRPRQLVFDTLASSNHPVNMRSILNALDCKVNRASVYRIVELFESLGIVVIVPNGWKNLYELSGLFKPHHHHLICEKCGQMVDIKSDEVEQLVSYIAREHDFTVRSHHFEIFGTCDKCARSNQRAE